ncbi:MAG: phenylalanine 4-monooxygenase [Gemmatimonadota bacterium]|nr:phenylalanine 4-monooxygenase [Gemmatimonadota bacterium]
MHAAEIAQDWSTYTPTDHQVWASLYRRRMDTLRSTASSLFLEGIDAIGLREDRVPDLDDVNRRLAPRTGWRAVPVAGFLPAGEFFASLARREFPTTITVRPPEQLEYLPEPDIFHDVFGHVPLHADPAFADFLQAFGAEAARAEPAELERFTRLFWFTIEFGLVREAGQVRIYGSGLISSEKDAANALGPGCDRRPFSREAVMAQDFRIDDIQPVLYVVDGFKELLGEGEVGSEK